MGWNFGDLFDAAAASVPAGRPALIHGDMTLGWAELDRRTNRAARALLARGLQPGDRVAVMARNHPAFIEAVMAALKARMVYLTINYRYVADEVAYILADSGAAALCVQPEFAPAVAGARANLPSLLFALPSDGPSDGPGNGPELPGAEPWEALAGAGDGSPLGIERSGNDTYLVYTGGTTGRPKGVVWRQDAARATQLESPLARAVPRTLAEHAAAVAANPAPSRVVPACPLMHGAGINSSVAELANGGTVITLAARRFDAAELWSAASRHAATRVLIVGDVFARPMVAALDDAPDRYDLSALRAISSAGLTWSADTKAGLLRHLPGVTLLDIFGASEASSLGYAITDRTGAAPTGVFAPGPHTVLIGEDGVVLPREPGREGFVARSGALPEGYLGAPAKTAEVYRTVGGVRYGIPGDLGRWEPDGSLRLIGRGSLCINSGGEKIHPEEVEHALRQLPEVEDALVVGVPDPRWGHAVAALLLLRPGAAFDPAGARTALGGRLAGYKLPKALLPVDSLPRHDSGKANYLHAVAMATERMGMAS